MTRGHSSQSTGSPVNDTTGLLESNLATSLQRLKRASLFFVIPNAGTYCDEVVQDGTKIYLDHRIICDNVIY